MRLCHAIVAAAALAAGCATGPGVSWTTVGRSVEGRPIRRAVFGGGKSVTLVFGAFHGDEPESAEIARRLAGHLRENSQAVRGRAVVIVPEVNPDGLAAGTRGNARGVDLNRNIEVISWEPSRTGSRNYSGDVPASEPETRVVWRLMESCRPTVVVSIHSIGPEKRCVNYDGPAEELAKKMSELSGYPLAATMGYSTPGSFGTWSGRRLGIPTITLELPRGGDVDEIWEEVLPALLEAVRWRPRFGLEGGLDPYEPEW